MTPRKLLCSNPVLLLYSISGSLAYLAYLSIIQSDLLDKKGTIIFSVQLNSAIKQSHFAVAVSPVIHWRYRTRATGKSC